LHGGQDLAYANTKIGILEDAIPIRLHQSFVDLEKVREVLLLTPLATNARGAGSPLGR